jgi:uncharacterized protein DUF2510
MARSSFGRWFFGEDQPDPAEAHNPGVEKESPQVPGGKVGEEPQPAAAPPTPAGWYLTDGTLRYFDGAAWTDHVAPPYPASLKTSGIAGAVFLGVFAALFLVWLGAQIDPDHVYFPVKFVVEELPNF